MGDKGQWDLPTHKIEKMKLENKLEREIIEIDKAKLGKREIELKIAEQETRIKDFENRAEETKKCIAWSTKKIKELEDVRHKKRA